MKARIRFMIVGFACSFLLGIMAPSNLSAFQAQQSQGEHAHGGALRIGAMSILQPAYLNPLVDAFAVALDSGGYNVFSCLCRVNENGSLISDLAQTWEISNGGRNYTFYLHNDVMWHDGVPFNASDVKFTFNEILLNEDVNGWWKMLYSAANITSIEIQGQYLISIHLESPYAPLMTWISYTPIIPKHVYQSNFFDERVIGTGPFKHVKWAVGYNWTLEANQNYTWGNHSPPYLERVLIRWDIPLEELGENLISNQIDLVPGSGYSMIDWNSLEILEQNPGMTTVKTDEFTLPLMGANLRHPILSNTTVRKAIAYGIDREGIIRNVYSNVCTTSTGPVPPAANFWYNANVTIYEHNSTLAEVLLDQAGFERDSETGIRFSLSLKVSDYDSFITNATQMISEDLTNLGINVTLNIQEGSQTKEDLSSANFDLIVIRVRWWRGFDPEIVNYLYDINGDYNYWNYSNPQLNIILAQGLSSYNLAQRKTLYDQAQQIVAEDLPIIFLFHPMSTTGYHNDFHGFTISPSVKAMDPFSLENVWYEPTLSGQGKSPVRICFKDEFNRRTGFFNGSVLQEIPNSTYNEELNVVKIRSPEGNYTVEVNGTGNGTYSLEIVNIALGYKYTEIPLNTIYANQTRTYYVRVFPDGTLRVWDPMLDINRDWKIDIRDIAFVAVCFGTSQGDPGWNETADIYEDDKVDIRDVAMVARQFGKVW